MKVSIASNYSIKEVTALVEGYAELVNLKQHLWILVRMCDLTKNIPNLTKVHQDAILIYGIQNLDSRSSAAILGISHTTLLARYQGALSQLTFLMNGV